MERERTYKYYLVEGINGQEILLSKGNTDQEIYDNLENSSVINFFNITCAIHFGIACDPEGFALFFSNNKKYYLYTHSLFKGKVNSCQKCDKRTRCLFQCKKFVSCESCTKIPRIK